MKRLDTFLGCWEEITGCSIDMAQELGAGLLELLRGHSLKLVASDPDRERIDVDSGDLRPEAATLDEARRTAHERIANVMSSKCWLVTCERTPELAVGDVGPLSGRKQNGADHRRGAPSPPFMSGVDVIAAVAIREGDSRDLGEREAILEVRLGERRRLARSFAGIRPTQRLLGLLRGSHADRVRGSQVSRIESQLRSCHG